MLKGSIVVYLQWLDESRPAKRSFDGKRALRLTLKFYLAVALSAIIGILSLAWPHFGISALFRMRQQQQLHENRNEWRIKIMENPSQELITR